MRVIIAGSRDFDDRYVFLQGLEESGFNITEVVCGCARGADYIGGHWWAEKMCIPVRHFPADWDMYGKSAGPLRNRQMAKYVDEAFPDGGPSSSGMEPAEARST